MALPQHQPRVFYLCPKGCSPKGCLGRVEFISEMIPCDIDEGIYSINDPVPLYLADNLNYRTARCPKCDTLYIFKAKARIEIEEL